MDVLLAATSWQALLIAGLLGASVGSFLNVVIARLPKQLQLQWKYECAELAGEPVREKTQFNIAVPGSHCPKCQHAVAWYDIKKKEELTDDELKVHFYPYFTPVFTAFLPPFDPFQHLF